MFDKILFMDKVRQYKFRAKVTVKIQLKVVVVEVLEVAQGDEELLLLPQILVWNWCCLRPLTGGGLVTRISRILETKMNVYLLHICTNTFATPHLGTSLNLQPTYPLQICINLFLLNDILGELSSFFMCSTPCSPALQPVPPPRHSAPLP